MSNRGRWIAGGGALAGLAAAAVTLRAATGRWHRRTAELVHRIVAAPPRPDRAIPGEHSDTLPEPVQRYLSGVMTGGRRRIRAARLSSAGTFRQITSGSPAAPDSGWFAFTATQTFTVDPPAFVWAATMNMRPFVKVYVRDTYMDGHASMQGSALGLVPVVNAAGAPELTAGALMRYLAEAPWVPDALQPSARLRWSPIDATHARATLTDAGTTVSVVFEFSSSGDIVGVAAQRHRATDRGYEISPWEGRFWQHEVRGGIRIPTRGEIAWTLDAVSQPYWRGEILGADYDFMPPAVS